MISIALNGFTALFGNLFLQMPTATDFGTRQPRYVVLINPNTDDQATLIKHAEAVRGIVPTATLFGRTHRCLRAGEFADPNTLVIAPNDQLGLLSVMHALAVDYPELASDQRICGMARALQTPERGLSELADRLVKTIDVTPELDPAHPRLHMDAVQDAFLAFLAATTGEGAERETGLEHLNTKAQRYAVEKQLIGATASQAQRAAPIVFYVDISKTPHVNIRLLHDAMAVLPQCVFTAIRRSDGPYASKLGGAEVRVALVEAYRSECAAHALSRIPMITNRDILLSSRFVLHAGVKAWEQVVLPFLEPYKFEADAPPSPSLTPLHS